MSQKILFYDGNCGFCSKSVQFILKHRRNDFIKFAALQSDLAQLKLSQHNISIDLSTLYVLDKNVVYNKSNAALHLVKELKWYCKLLYIGYIVPKKFRDKIYDYIAKRRLRIAGEFCYLPTEEEKELFL